MWHGPDVSNANFEQGQDRGPWSWDLVYCDFQDKIQQYRIWRAEERGVEKWIMKIGGIIKLLDLWSGR
jgi:hypothetical protein